MELVKNILLLVLLPLLLSRLFRLVKLDFRRYDTQVINLLFFFTIYGFIGLNRDTIVSQLFSLKEVALVLLIRTSGISFLVYLFLKKLNVEKKYIVSVVLFSGYKNLGYAALLSLSLFGREAALPATLGIIFETVTFIMLERAIRNR